MERQVTSPEAESPARREFYDRISRQNLTPLWLSLSRLVTPEPASACRPTAWAFADIRAAMIEAGGLITAKEAERRVLVLENPGLRGQSKITTDTVLFSFSDRPVQEALHLHREDRQGA